MLVVCDVSKVVSSILCVLFYALIIDIRHYNLVCRTVLLLFNFFCLKSVVPNGDVHASRGKDFAYLPQAA